MTRNGAGNAECLQALADSGSSVSGTRAALFDRDSAANGVRPLSVFKADRLNALYKLVDIKTLLLAHIRAFLNGVDTVFFDNSENLLFTSVIRFK